MRSCLGYLLEKKNERQMGLDKGKERRGMRDTTKWEAYTKGIRRDRMKQRQIFGGDYGIENKL